MQVDSHASSAPHASVNSQACPTDRKSTRLNSSHSQISYAVFCLKKKTIIKYPVHRIMSASERDWPVEYDPSFTCMSGLLMIDAMHRSTATRLSGRRFTTRSSVDC